MIDDTVVESVTQAVVGANDGAGQLAEYGLLYEKRTMANMTYVAFADSANTSSWQSLAGTLAIAAIVVLAVFFVIMSMLYAVSPIDLAPDTIPVVGWLDDLGFLVTATMNAVQQFAKNQDSAMVKVLKYTKWLLVVATIIAALLLGGLLVSLGLLIAYAVG